MAGFKEIFQEADWKIEKHAPVIEAMDVVKKGDTVNISVSVGKQIAHPNTTEHHISYIEIFFLPKAEKFPYNIGKFEFNAHGASIQGPNTSTIFTQSAITVNLKTEKSGFIIASSYCNIHGLWESSREIIVE